MPRGGPVLVAYATKMGGTQEVAARIGELLKKQGIAAKVVSARDVKDLEGFYAVVLGTGIRAGRVYAEALKFANRFGPILSDMPVALFSVGLQVVEDTEENREKALAFIQPLVDLLKPKAIATFAGHVDREKLGWLWGRLFRMAAKQMEREGRDPYQDFRDWGKIEQWALTLPVALGLVTPKGNQ